MMKTPNEKSPLRTIDAAAYLAVSTRTVRRWISAGELVAHRLGRRWRVSKTDLAAFLHQRRHG